MVIFDLYNTSVFDAKIWPTNASKTSTSIFCWINDSTWDFRQLYLNVVQYASPKSSTLLDGIKKGVPIIVHAIVVFGCRVRAAISLESFSERILERVVLDHWLHEDQRVQLWHRVHRILDFRFRDFDQLTIVLLRGQGKHSVSGDPIVPLSSLKVKLFDVRLVCLLSQTHSLILYVRQSLGCVIGRQLVLRSRVTVKIWYIIALDIDCYFKQTFISGKLILSFGSLISISKIRSFSSGDMSRSSGNTRGWHLEVVMKTYYNQMVTYFYHSL